MDIEVDESMPASEVTKLSRRLIRVAAEQGLTLTSVGITGSNLSDPQAAEIWDIILDKARSPQYSDILKAQQFTVDFEKNIISFYAVLDYSSKTRELTLEQFREDLQQVFPGMQIEIFKEIDI